MKNKIILEHQNEIQRDYDSRFVAEQYISEGYPLHFHRNLEIYGVLHGKVEVKVAGELKVIEDGQFAIINGMESHSYGIVNESEIFFFHIGSQYLKNFYILYPNQFLPHWLLDKEYNEKLYNYIKTEVIDAGPSMSDLKKLSIVGYLISNIIEHYGTVDRHNISKKDGELIDRIIQYVYEHYNENISLKMLSEKFFISPKALSKKISNTLNEDFRMFVNDVRVQKVVEIMNDPNNINKNLREVVEKCGFVNMNTYYRSYARNFKLVKVSASVQENNHTS